MDEAEFSRFLATIHPYDSFGHDEIARVAELFRATAFQTGETIYAFGKPLDGLYLIESGHVTVFDEDGAQLSSLSRGNSFGERGLLRDGLAATTAIAAEDSRLWVLPKESFDELNQTQPAFQRFFSRGTRRPTTTRPEDLTTARVADLMSKNPKTCLPQATVVEAAKQMREHRVSSLCVTDNDGKLIGILTLRDLSGRVLAEGRPADTPVETVMTPHPITLPPDAIGTDVLNAMMERSISHLPIMDGQALVGIVTKTDLTRRQALSSSFLVGDVAKATDAESIRKVTARIPALLAQLVGAGNRHDVVTRLVTDIADAATRRLLLLAEQSLGTPPVPYLWLACGSQGRREQTGVSDQDNCLILDDSVTKDDMAYFEALAKFVTDGLNTAGYVYCPGEMMASTPRWRQPLSVWRDYFRGWIATPNPEAQMLSSVMFDLRAIGGPAEELLETLQGETLEAASKNSIFVAHMVANSLKHRPPLGLLRGFATMRTGDNRNAIDMKANGVVPITDLARLYALMAELRPVNTRKRIESAAGTKAVSTSGGQDLLDAYDVIAQARLEHQARRVAASETPDNFLPPTELSDFERSHLRDAFVVVRTMQAAVAQGRGTVM
jgi:CBS domain-containing protein